MILIFPRKDTEALRPGVRGFRQLRSFRTYFVLALFCKGHVCLGTIFGQVERPLWHFVAWRRLGDRNINKALRGALFLESCSTFVFGATFKVLKAGI
jgi:hypothetical protein